MICCFYCSLLFRNCQILHVFYLNYSNTTPEDNTNSNTSTVSTIATLRPKGHTKSASLTVTGRNTSELRPDSAGDTNRPRFGL